MNILFIGLFFSSFLRAAVGNLVIPLQEGFMQAPPKETTRFGVADDLSVHYYKPEETDDAFNLRLKEEKIHIIRCFSLKIKPSGMGDFRMIEQVNLSKWKKTVGSGYSCTDNSVSLSFSEKIVCSWSLSCMVPLLFFHPSVKKIALPWTAENYNFQDIFGKFLTDADLFSFDKDEQTLFCMKPRNQNGEIDFWYADCKFLLDEQYTKFYQPIANLKKMRFRNLSGVIKNTALFLKYAFYDAHGNRRLQKSLIVVFLANAHSTLFWLLSCYYTVAVILFTELCLHGIGCVNLAGRFVLLHFAGNIMLNIIMMRAASRK